MIIELSKDKSLLNILSKAELDEETSRLVECNASTSIIKRSLERNLNSSNIVQYRKYIAKAEDDEEEFDEDDATEDEINAKLEEDNAKQEEDDAKDLADAADDKEDEEDDEDDEDFISADLSETAFAVANDEKSKRTKRVEATTMANANLKAQGSKKAFTQLSIYNRYLKPLQEIVSKVVVVDKPFKGKDRLKAINGDAIYKKLANTSDKSEQVLNLFQQLDIDDYFITTKYRKHLIQGEYKGKNFKTDKKTGAITAKDNSKKDINIKTMQADLRKLLELTFPVKDSSKKVSFFELLGLLHVNLYTNEPKVTVDRPKAKRESKRAKDFLRGHNPRVNDAYEREKKKVDTFKLTMRGLVTQSTLYDDTLEELNELNESDNIDKFISKKVRNLTNAYRTLVSSGKVTQENLQEMKKELEEINNNKDKYIDEAREELEQNLEEEEAKIEEVKELLRRFTEVKPYINKLSKYYYMYEEEQAPDFIKIKITKASAVVIKMHRVSVDMEEISSENGEELAESVEELVTHKGKEIQSLDDFAGIVDSLEAMNSMKRLSKKMAEYVIDFKAVLNEIELAIGGEINDASERDRGI